LHDLLFALDLSAMAVAAKLRRSDAPGQLPQTPRPARSRLAMTSSVRLGPAQHRPLRCGGAAPRRKEESLAVPAE